MNNYFDQQAQRLDEFKHYLIKEQKLSEITAKDYVRRIVSICNEENITLDALTENIEKFAFDYIEGEKSDLGRRSHNSYRSAIKQYSFFVLNNKGTISATKHRYHIDVNKVPGEHFAVIKLIDQDTNQVLDTDASISTEHHSHAEVGRDIGSKALNMVIRTLYPNGDSVFTDLLKTFDVSMTFDGNTVIK